MKVDLTQAIALLRRGEVVAIPTETVYGLAADASNDDALRQIYEIKGRPADNPLIVHIADARKVNDYATTFPPLAQKLANAFWPGPFTLVLPAKNNVSKIVRGGYSTVALRVPSHPIALQLLSESGLALAAPSANKFTQLSPTNAAHVTAGLGEEIPVLEGGSCKVGIESTIVSVSGDNWQMLRLGMVPESSVEEIAGKPSLNENQDLPKAPGQHLLHYSPRTTVKLFSSRKDLVAFATSHKNCVALVFGEDVAPNCKYFSLPNRPIEAAEGLYDTLHQMDSMKMDLLLIELPEKLPNWLAILDRLTRSAHKNL
jgi:L-threonylcarbamoyladenylate synthase